MTFKDLRMKIYDCIQFGDSVMRELNGDDIENYNIRLLTIYTHINEKKPFMQLRYELKGDIFRLWAATEDGKGITGIPQSDNIEEALDNVTNTILNGIKFLKDESLIYTIDWLGD